jgi:hypothetical protein
MRKNVKVVMGHRPWQDYIVSEVTNAVDAGWDLMAAGGAAVVVCTWVHVPVSLPVVLVVFALYRLWRDGEVLGFRRVFVPARWRQWARVGR